MTMSEWLVSVVVDPVVTMWRSCFTPVPAEAQQPILTVISYALILTAVPVAAALLGGQTAAYGRYTAGSSAKWGFLVPGKLAWLVQEAPNLVIGWAILLFHAYQDASIQNTANLVLFGLFQLHYIHRTLVFPLFLKGKPTRFWVFFSALVFCTLNGYLQSSWLLNVHVYPSDWIAQPNFLVGVCVFFLGMAVNMHSDYTLLSLRKSSKDKGYKIPQGGMFTFVSGANYFGEILEWTGFAIASWSLPALAFAVFTASNIGPRAYQHHLWYREKFDDYPKDRKALIPFIW